MSALRRIRGILRMGAVWGIALSATTATVLLSGLALGVLPASVFGATQILQAALRGLAFGALAGAIFAAALSTGERRQTLATLSTRRAALWGALGGACIPACVVLVFGAGGHLAGMVGAAVLGASTLGMGAMGSALGAGSVRLAQRSEGIALRSPAVRDAALLNPPA